VPITALEVTSTKSSHNPFKEALYADVKIFDYKARSSKFFVEQLKSLQTLMSDSKNTHQYTLRLLSNKHIGKYLEKLQRSEYINNDSKPTVSLTGTVEKITTLPYIQEMLQYVDSLVDGNDLSTEKQESAKVYQELYMNAIIPLLFDKDSTKLTILNAMIG
jgi:hypothetical protein